MWYFFPSLKVVYKSAVGTIVLVLYECSYRAVVVRESERGHTASNDMFVYVVLTFWNKRNITSARYKRHFFECTSANYFHCAYSVIKSTNNSQTNEQTHFQEDIMNWLLLSTILILNVQYIICQGISSFFSFIHTFLL